MTTILQCDSCGKQAPPDRRRFHSDLGPNYEWVVLYVEANDDADHGHFCSWACLAAVATQRSIERELPTADAWLDRDAD